MMRCPGSCTSRIPQLHSREASLDAEALQVPAAHCGWTRAGMEVLGAERTRWARGDRQLLTACWLYFPVGPTYYYHLMGRSFCSFLPSWSV